MYSKKLNSLFLILILFLYDGGLTFSQNNKHNAGKESNIITQKINKIKQTHNFKDINLFGIDKINQQTEADKTKQNTTFLKLNRKELTTLLLDKNENITVKLPTYDGKIVELELTKVNILADDFKIAVAEGSTIKYINYSSGLYYQGIMRGNNQSLATMSIFDDYVVGMITNGETNFTIVRTDEKMTKSTEYKFYDDKERRGEEEDFICGTTDVFEIDSKTVPPNKNDGGDNPASLPIKVYFECDYQTYLDKGGVSGATNFITGIFNSVAGIYSNIPVPLQISHVIIWQSPDPYINMTDYSTIISAFQNNKNSERIYGHIGHLITTRTINFNGASGVAFLISPCSNSNINSSWGYSYAWNQMAFSNNTNIKILAHETGHIFGSHHTHWCGWLIAPPSTYGPIDRCATCEGCSCSIYYSQGTIMSYCSNYTLTFHSLCSDVIRSSYNDAVNGCLADLYLYGDRTISSSGGSQTYDATNSITTTYNNAQFNLLNGSNITFHAGSSITLTDGFHAQTGSTFSAYIQPFSDDGDFVSNDMKVTNIIEKTVNSAPIDFSLSQNYPNPFNPTTLIQYGLKENVSVRISIYDILGRIVKTLVNEFQEAGYKSVVWDGTNNSGSSVSTGLYIYKIEAGSFVDSKKMLLLK